MRVAGPRAGADVPVASPPIKEVTHQSSCWWWFTTQPRVDTQGQRRGYCLTPSYPFDQECEVRGGRHARPLNAETGTVLKAPVDSP